MLSHNNGIKIKKNNKKNQANIPAAKNYNWQNVTALLYCAYNSEKKKPCNMFSNPFHFYSIISISVEIFSYICACEEQGL